MSSNAYRLLRWAERRRGVAFLTGGVVFVGDTALLVWHLSAGTEPAAFGQGLVGLAWTAAFLGLLGVYPGLAGRAPRLAKAGALFAVVGSLAMAAMAVTSMAYWLGLLSGTLAGVVGYFLPGVFVGIVLGFGSFAVVALRGHETRRLGLLFLALVLAFLFNLGTGVIGFNPPVKILGVVVVLSLTMLTIGYLLRTGQVTVDPERVEATTVA